MSACLIGCHHARTEDPSKSYRTISEIFLSGRLHDADQAASEAANHFRPSDPQWAFRFRVLDCDVLTWLGRSQDVIASLQEGQRSFSPTGDLAIKANLLLSLAYARIGQEQKSEQMMALAQEAAERTHSNMQAEMYQTLGVLQRRRKEFTAADESTKRSLELARKSGLIFIEAGDLSNLGRAALQEDHLDEGLDLLNASAKVAASIHAALIAETVTGNAGTAYYQLGDFERAIANFREAQEQARISGRTTTEILWLQDEGGALWRMGELDQARIKYDQALTKLSSIHDPKRDIQIKSSLSLLDLQLENFPAARANAEAALETARLIKDDIETIHIEISLGLIGVRDLPAKDAEGVLAKLIHDTQDIPSNRWQIENAYGTLYVREREPAKAERWFRKSIKTFEDLRSHVGGDESRLPFFAYGDSLYGDYANFLLSQHRPEDALYLLDKSRSRTLEDSLANSGTNGAKKSIANTANSLGSVDAKATAKSLGGIILFYSMDEPRSHLWVISNERVELVQLPAKSEIAKHIDSYQASILRSVDPLREQNADAQWLYQALVAPAEKLIGKRDNVFLVRNGKLDGLNFEMLLKPDEHGAHYWLDDVRITNASSIKLLARSVERRQKANGNDHKLLLIGDPISPSSEYPALANAGHEVESVHRYFPQPSSTVITQSAATPDAYAKSHPEAFSYIHFVAHGTASTLRPLDSAVILSAPPKQKENFRLYARDIIRQPISADLVTISACYGSGLRDFSGEGLVGLSWAFLRAGSHNVVGALWAIDDASTAQLMDHLYQNLSQNKSPSEALRDAKLAMLHSDSVYRKPFYWAAFQLYSGS